MTFVIPMAGAGSRFTAAGYQLPKYLISVKGKTLLQYSLESLPLELAANIIFIALKEQVVRYNLNQVIETLLKGRPFIIYSLEHGTRGQAETVMLAAHLIPPDQDIVIYNIDTFFKSGTLATTLMNPAKKDGVLGYFTDTHPKWSFALIDPVRKEVVRTTEKEPVSDMALTGMYHFTKASDFFTVATRHISNNITTKSEFYIAPMYNDLISSGKKFVMDFADSFVALGTPEDVESFKAN